MKYFEGDIVEIISSSYKSYAEMPRHQQSYYDDYGRTPEFIGQRFKIALVYDNMVASGPYPNGLMIRTNNVFLYRRPFINWIKYLISFFVK